MNTKNLKAYAPKARRQFIEAVKKRAAQLGIYEDRIAEVQIQGDTAVIEGRVFTRKQGEQRKRLAQRVAERGFDMFTREMAYTWFNRLAAIRYMELHDYLEHGFRVLSHPSNPENLPEILDHASDVADTLALDKSHIIELQLAGDQEEELYRELLLGQCHHLYNIMPFMFEAIDDATELLLPNNLTKTDSILKGIVNDIPEEDWQEIEVIGWLYQFYISEHKYSVMGKVVKSEDIPAATQLFTPNWIVKYLVQNSLGRHWLATYPGSELKSKMEYYIEPAKQSDDVIEQLKAITPASIDPEEIKIIDPAVGSGHILVEVYELLRDIYLERGYRLREIPELILTKNIYGLDIDDRAAQLAGFALMMKAREDDRRIFHRVEDGEVLLNVYSLQSTEHLDIPKLWKALDFEGIQQAGSTGGLFDGMGDSSDEFIEPSGIYKEFYKLLQTLKSTFLQAKTLGSLIQIENEHFANLVALKELLQTKEQGSDPAAKQAAIELLPIINQAIILAQRYISTIMNPPYLGSKGMNSELKDFAKKQFPNSKSDLFALFMERAFSLLTDNGYNAQVNMQSWMFLSSYESLREWLLDTKTFVTMAHLGARAFGQISGEVVQTTAWVLKKSDISSYRPSFFRLIEGNEEQKKNNLKLGCSKFSDSRQEEFHIIPGSPIAYWVSQEFRRVFEEYPLLSESTDIKQGLATADNDRFLRYWYEVEIDKCSFTSAQDDELTKATHKWFPHSKGGGYKKWYGKREWVVNWEDQGKELLDFRPRSVIRNPDKYFKPCLSWSLISSSGLSFRYEPQGNIIGHKGPGVFTKNIEIEKLLPLLNSVVAEKILDFIAPGLGYEIGQVAKIPVIDLKDDSFNKAVQLAKEDWDSQECSWDFDGFLVGISNGSLQQTVNAFISKWENNTNELLAIEESINKKAINSYGLNEQLNPDVELAKISLENNYLYSFSKGGKNAFISSLVERLASYSIGAMMGRFSLDRKGFVYAKFGNNGFKELVADGAYKTFPADDDGIVPLASEDWFFDDDATARFKEFVKTVWGNENLDENLDFVAESLCLHALKPKKGEGAMNTVRRYFSTQFFKDHCKTYKKRPIYWLFSSGKEKAFECLVYLHRYNEGSLSRMRTEYVTPLMGKYDAQLTRLSEEKVEATGAEARRIEKDLKSLEKKQAELRNFDEQLKHYAERRITLDLDDGVKTNYGKFGNLLADVKAIHGKAVK